MIETSHFSVLNVIFLMTGRAAYENIVAEQRSLCCCLDCQIDSTVLASDHTDGMIAQIPCHVSPDFVVRTISDGSPLALELTTCEDLVTGNVKHRFTTLPYGHHVTLAEQHLSCRLMHLD